ncbi:MAG: hypothetical protein IKZ47_04600 [Clostridia bacterium]|nr:hypothetical protein [Clostridia bacterium]
MREHLWLKIFFAVLAVIFIAHQLYASLYKPIVTETAQYYEMVVGVTADAVIIRNETVITNDSPGALHYITADGSRAAKGGVIAEIYADSAISGKISRLHTVEKELENITQIEEYNNVQAPDMDLINGKVNDALNEVVRAGAAGNYQRFDQLAEQFVMSINRRQVLTGELTDFSAQKAALTAELNELRASIPQPSGYVRSSVSGYFVSTTDGYEEVLTADDLTAITPERLDNVSPVPAPENAIGKTVSDYEWYVAARMSINDSLKYKQGDTVTVKTSLKTAPELSMKVERINLSADGERAVLVLSCQQMNSDLAEMRDGTVTIVSKVYKGLRLSSKALRVVDKTTGVYTVSGMRLKFVPVNVIYSTEDFIICAESDEPFSNTNALKLYDEVVVKGKGLYDGKVIG